MPTPQIIALIPARSGSKRIADKNVRALAGHPLLVYSIASARESGIFKKVVLSTDSEEYAQIGKQYGAEVPFLRPEVISGDQSTDFEWVEYTLKRLETEGMKFDCFSILRPTSPFRQADTIQRAWKQFLEDKKADSLRAVEKCKQHPAKMWMVEGKRMSPFFKYEKNGQPGHSCQYPTLPVVYVQNASLEIAWTRVIFENKNISGNQVLPFFTEGFEGFDVNHPLDFEMADLLIKKGEATLPVISKKMRS